MSAVPGARPHVRTDLGPLDIERLHVAARAVLGWIEETDAEGIAPARVDQITRHARALVDMGDLAPSPFAATRAHALTVRNELIVLATEHSLTMAVWFDDALGLGGRRGEATPAHPPGA